MARGRMLNASVAGDIELNELSLEAHFAYMMAIPHLDRDGIMEGHPRVLAGRICPLRPEIGAKMADIIAEWVAAGLVIAYRDGNKPLLYFTGFQKNQNLGATYAREGKSAFPCPPGYIRTPTGLTHDELMSNSCVSQPEEKRREVEDQEKEVVAASENAPKEKPSATTTSSDVARLWKKWDANMPGAKTQVMVDGVNDLLTEYSIAEIEEAIEIAIRRDNRSLGYVEGILRKGVFKHTNGSAPPRLSEEQKSAIATRAKLARSSLASAQKFKTRIDPQWQKDIETAKEYGL